MPVHSRRSGKRPALRSVPGRHQSRSFPGQSIGARLSTGGMEPDHSSINHSPRTTIGMLALSAIVAEETTNPPIDYKPPGTTRYALGRGDEFPTQRRPELRALSDDPEEMVDSWFTKSGITIGAKADTPEKMSRAKRLMYTWREFFATSVREIKPTDLIEHSIDLLPNARPVQGKLPRYTAQEREFANRIFPELEDAGIIARRSSAWGARTKFPPKKKDSPLMRVVHNYIPLNNHTVKSAYPMHRLEEVIDILMKPRHDTYFTSDAANGYWAIPMKPEDCNKTGFLTPNGQWVYKRMGQGLKGAPHTYAQFSDLVFGPLPKTASVPRMPTVIGHHGASSFAVFMDDHSAAGDDFDALFDFLHTKYFPRVGFGPVYLSGHKTFVFTDSLSMLGFEGNGEGIRPSVKYRTKILEWPIPQNRKELDGFIWLTPFIRIFLPGRAGHVLKLKEAYLEQKPLELKEKRAHDGEIEDCDKDPTKTTKARPKRPTVQRKWVEKENFEWTSEQQESFDAIKQAVSDNAMAGADPDLQYHLAVDASENNVGGVLFQLKGTPPGTEATSKFKDNERIIMFMSFRMTDAESRYVNSERECLAVVRCLAEVKWLVIGNKHPVILYSDHEALQKIFNTGQTEKGRISNWLDRLGEYDIKLCYRPSTDQHIAIADGLSRMPTRLTSIPVAEDTERMAMKTEIYANASLNFENLDSPAGVPSTPDPNPTSSRVKEPPGIQSLPRRIFHEYNDRLAKYKTSPMYQGIVEYLQGGLEAIQDKFSRNVRRQIVRKALKYRLPEPHQMPAVLRYMERTGATSICMIEEEVSSILQAAHEDHGHYASALTLDFLIGRAYWPTRVHDVFRWCQSCPSCQLRSKKPIKADKQAILKFAPMDMLGMDWLGPISPACTATGCKYILIVVDYFTRFVWAKAYVEHEGKETVHMYEHHICPIFGFPRSVYSDNGSHFVNQWVERLFREHGVTHYTGPISHPSSTGLMERAVQAMQSFLRARCLEREEPGAWSLDVRDGVLYINTKTIRIHGYLPAELMLGFEPKLIHFDTDC